ncbi:MAG: hypothetical protein EBZ69_00105 [Alphaproteobacteria bacterium]|nr:hypothetical protein [Alphaproteobacteria bacterium]
MFQIQNVPIVIEPGVEAIEAEFFAVERHGKARSFPVQLFRVNLDEKVAQILPFIPSVQRPHVFSLAQNPEESLALVVYDVLGRIQHVYTRDSAKRSWEKRDVADEHAGKTIKQFSIRYFFSTKESRDEFMRCVDGIISSLTQKKEPSQREIATAFNILSRARSEPVVLPVAVAKSSRKQVKI